MSPVRRAGATLATGVDRAFARTVLQRSAASRRRSRAESLTPEQRIAAAEAIADSYDPALLSDPDRFFPAPAVPAGLRERRVRAFGRGGVVIDLRWPSDYEPVTTDPELAARFLGFERNRRAAARLVAHRGGGPRPAVILVHGYLGGNHAFEERAWPLRWLYRRGFDVALAVLPFHGVRREPGRLRPPFPASDPRFTIEGFRQAIGDLRTLHRILLDRGARSVGTMGMSLGGYSTALLATAEPGLAFAVPFIPLASIAMVARAEGRLTGTDAQRARQFEAVERLHALVSPLARPARVAPERILVVAGQADQVVPADEHARALAEHFGARLETFPGGHLLQLGRADAFRRLGRFFGSLEL